MSHTTDSSSSTPDSRSDELAGCRRRITELSAEVGVLRQALAIRQFNADSTYRIIFDSIIDAVFIQTVEDGTIVDVNRRAVIVSGYGRDELLGESFMLLDSAASSSPLVPGNTMWESAQAGAELQFERSI
ncbi:MAG TPA: PAS domain-containing protein, partial [Roseiflexaceae bacterium]|nr:PAS domain-containing protein [Roseiflexaceae bacterium]